MKWNRTFGFLWLVFALGDLYFHDWSEFISDVLIAMLWFRLSQYED